MPKAPHISTGNVDSSVVPRAEVKALSPVVEKIYSAARYAVILTVSAAGVLGMGGVAMPDEAKAEVVESRLDTRAAEAKKREEARKYREQKEAAQSERKTSDQNIARMLAQLKERKALALAKTD